MSGLQEAVATCTGERVVRRPAPLRQQTETMSRGASATRLLTELRNSGVLTGSRMRPGAPGACTGWLAAGRVRNTKDRDALALEVRAGTTGVGRTAQDAAGLGSTNRNRGKVARTSVENGPQSLRSVTEGEFQPLLFWLSEEAQQTARESHQRTKAWKYRLTGCPSPSPLAGDMETLPKQGFLSISAAGPTPRRQAEKSRSPLPRAPEWRSH